MTPRSYWAGRLQDPRSSTVPVTHELSKQWRGHSQRRAGSYPRGMLLHLVLVTVSATGVATPKAVLAELIIVALLASVSEAHHALAVTVGALHRMEDWRAERRESRINTEENKI